MNLLALLLLSGLGLTTPTALAQTPNPPDSLDAPAATQPAPPVLGTPTRRCRDHIDALAAGASPVAQARCSGAFGVPGVPSAGKADGVGAQLRGRMTAASLAALEARRNARE
jgi:hypothetical protein